MNIKHISTQSNYRGACGTSISAGGTLTSTAIGSGYFADYDVNIVASTRDTSELSNLGELLGKEVKIVAVGSDCKKDCDCVKGGACFRVGDNCELRCEFCEDEFEDELEDDEILDLGIRNIEVNEAKRLVVTVFEDGSVYKQKCREGDEFDVNVGVALSVAEHEYGTKTKFHKEIAAKLVKKKKKAEKK